MQLFLNAETTMDIEKKMAALDEESLHTKEDADIIVKDLNSDVSNGNKENIQTHGNKILLSTEDVDNDKDVNDVSDFSSETEPTNVEKCVLDSKEDKTELDKDEIQESKIDERSLKENKKLRVDETELGLTKDSRVGETESCETNECKVDKIEMNVSKMNETEVDESKMDENELDESKEFEVDQTELEKTNEAQTEIELDDTTLSKVDKTESNETTDSKVAEIDLDKNNEHKPKEIELSETKKSNVNETESQKTNESKIDLIELHKTKIHELDFNNKSQEDQTELGEKDTSNESEIRIELNEKDETMKNMANKLENLPVSDNHNVASHIDRVDAFKKNESLKDNVSVTEEQQHNITKENNTEKKVDTVVVSQGNVPIERSELNDISMEEPIQIDKSKEDGTNDTEETHTKPNNINKCDEMVVDEIKDTEKDSSDSKTASIANVKQHEVITVKEIKDTETENKSESANIITKNLEAQKEDMKEVFTQSTAKTSLTCRLSNTLDILSDDDEDLPKEDMKKENTGSDKQCINLEDDDDILLIDDDINIKNKSSEPSKENSKEPKSKTIEANCDLNISDETLRKLLTSKQQEVKVTPQDETKTIKDTVVPEVETAQPVISPQINEKAETVPEFKVDHQKPLLPEKVLQSCKKNFAEMTRDDLEEFCILKIVESIVDRSNISEIKSKLKTMAQNIEEYKKKAMMLTKQNRDLQVVLKSIQEEQKNATDGPITPLKITRSVGMQVLMTGKPNTKRKVEPALQMNAFPGNATPNNRIVKNTNQSPRAQRTPTPNSQQIPVPRLVPAVNNTAVNKSLPGNTTNNAVKMTSPVANGVKTPPVTKAPEKRSRSQMQSVTVDLTDDEPPSKVAPRNSPMPPVRLVPSQNLMQPRQQFVNQAINNPRKVYIPISGPQGQNVRGQTITVKQVPNPRPRGPSPHMLRMQTNALRMPRIQGRHPAPLPDAMKQYQPPNWKALPPAPDLKLSKVENGIVISWKIEGYQEDSYEEIASYQLYAYQETSSPPSTALWKKIGDVKALPLPMACTLTQFMAGFKYYFAVRAVDIRSRLGPFSLPGSILLLNKM